MKATFIRGLGLALTAGLFVFAGAKADLHQSHYFSLAGSWRLNQADSHYPGGYLRLQNETLEVARDDGTILQYTDSGLAPDGIVKSYSVKAYWGANSTLGSDGSEISLWHIGSREFRFIRRAPWDKYQIAAGRWRDEICKIAADGSRLTCVPEAGLQWWRLREVYDKIVGS